MTPRISSSERPKEATFTGSTWMRTAGFCWPATSTLATPEIWLMCWSSDRGLDILRRAVDIARQVELDRDRAVAERAARRHLRDARDLPELPLQRLRDRGCHDLGAGAGQLRGDQDRREIDLRQRGYRNERISRRTDEQDPGHQQRGRNRPRDEGARNAHLVFLLRAGDERRRSAP